MEVHFFDVEHGSCALICTDTNQHLLMDRGHSGERNWRPSQFLPYCGIRTVDRLFVTNWDEDHVSDLPGLFRSVYVPILHRNPTVSPYHVLRMKEENGPGEGVLSLAYMAANHYVAPVANPPDLGALWFSEYWNTPLHGFDDTNNLGLVVFFHYFDLHVLFPGDLEKAGWMRLLQNAGFRYELSLVNVFVASHHGRKNGYCREVFGYCNPEIVVVSDKSIVHDTQTTAAQYGQHTRGVYFNDRMTRYVLTTRNNGHIAIRKAGPQQAWITIEKR
jgi:hypothetical protein